MALPANQEQVFVGGSKIRPEDAQEFIGKLKLLLFG
jgi:hypothetical protein